MREIQKIACANSAGAILSFRVVRELRTTDPEDRADNKLEAYPVSHTDSGSFNLHRDAVVDLAATTLAEGTVVWPVISEVISGVFGKSTTVAERFVFRLNGQTATFHVTGTANDLKATLL